ncbi:MAG: hypothetical protein LR011_01570 [Verrucomicrobia bacterium]|nr:hypothetical protein [Verrucomicrobiota bacterium]
MLALETSSGNLVTSGGRVLGVTALDHSLEAARNLAYQAVDQIHFQGAFFRRDIAAKAFAGYHHSIS